MNANEIKLSIRMIPTMKKIPASRYFPAVIYFLIAISILFQYREYYILTLDMIFPIKNLFIDQFYGFVPPVWGGQIFLAIPIIPSWLLQKIYLFLIIFISGISTYYLVNTKSSISRYYAGILYSINPFVYSRFLAGQWQILLAYSFVPFSLKFFLDFLANQNKKSLIKSVFLTAIVGLSSSHIVLILFILYLILIIFKLYQIRDVAIQVKNIILYSTIFMMLNLLLNSYWIIPIMTKSTWVENIGDRAFEVFAPKGGLFDIASMHGFWREGYLYAKDFLPGWQVLYLIILSLAIIGFISYYKDQEIGIYARAFAMIGIVGFILASGVNGPYGDMVRWLFDNTIFKGFRDSHKFVVMMVLAYSVLGGLGVNKIKSVYDNKYN